HDFICHEPMPTESLTLSLHDALPILGATGRERKKNPDSPLPSRPGKTNAHFLPDGLPGKEIRDGRINLKMQVSRFFHRRPPIDIDRKSTRLNSSHVKTSYAVFCLKKK